jgi:hypothetical protein
MAEVLHYAKEIFFTLTHPLLPYYQTGHEHHYLYRSEYFYQKNIVASAHPYVPIDAPPVPPPGFGGDRRLAVTGGEVLPGPQEVPSITYMRARITSNFYMRFYVRNVGWDPVYGYEVWFSEIRE